MNNFKGINEYEKELDRILTVNNYISLEPFPEGALVYIFDSGRLIKGKFIKYIPCYSKGILNGDKKFNPPCDKCLGGMELKEENVKGQWVSNCNTAGWENAHRRVFLRTDPIITAIQIYFNY